MKMDSSSNKLDANAVMDKVGSMTSRHALLTTLILLIPILYLEVPMLLMKGYYSLAVVRKPHAPRRSRHKVRPVDIPVPIDPALQVIKEEPKDDIHLTEEQEKEEEGEEKPGAVVEEEQEVEEEDEGVLKCPSGLVLLAGATGSVGGKATQLLLNQGYCVRVLTESLPQGRERLADLKEDEHLEFVEGRLGDGVSVRQAFEPRASSDYASVTHVLFAAAASSSNTMDPRGVEEWAAAAASVGTVRSMVVLSAAWVSKPYSLASLLYNGIYDNLPSAKQWQLEDALRGIASQREYACDDYDGYCATTNETRVPLNYVILRSGRMVPDENFPMDGRQQGIRLSQEDSFDFRGATPGMSHSQMAEAAVVALKVEGKYTVEVTSGPTQAGDAQKVFSMLLQDDESPAFSINQTVTMQDVERVHAQAMADFCNVIFTLVVGTILLVALLGPGQGLFLSMTLYIITVLMWRTCLSNRTIWDCLASEMPRKLPLLQVPGLSFGISIAHS